MTISYRTQFDTIRRMAAVATFTVGGRVIVAGVGTAMRWSFSGNRSSWAACIGPFILAVN